LPEVESVELRRISYQVCFEVVAPSASGRRQQYGSQPRHASSGVAVERFFLLATIASGNEPKRVPRASVQHRRTFGSDRFDTNHRIELRRK